MANRLTENHGWKVLLLEVGDEETDMLTDVPLTAAVTVLTSVFFSDLIVCYLVKFHERNFFFKLSKGTIGGTERKERKMLVCIWKEVFATGRKEEHLVAPASLITWSSIGTDSLLIKQLIT